MFMREKLMGGGPPEPQANLEYTAMLFWLRSMPA